VQGEGSLDSKGYQFHRRLKARLASYPGLLTPVFVTCSTNMGEGLLGLITCNDVPGHWGDMWRSGTFQEKPQVHVSECTIDCKHGP